MKNLIILFLAAALAFSCNTDKCKDVVCTIGTCEDGICVDPCDGIDCGIGGNCTTGLCLCDAGYEQDTSGSCNIEMRTKFIGSWVVSDVCSNSGTASYTVSTSNSSTSISNFNITNFWDLFTNAVSTNVTSSTEFMISRQEPDSDGYFVESIGAGTLSGNTISIQYVVSDETDLANISRDTCTSTWVKQ
jgi:hypothetical protein